MIVAFAFGFAFASTWSYFVVVVGTNFGLCSMVVVKRDALLE